MDNNREIVLEALLLHDKGEYADKIIKSILDKYSYLERFERSFINRVFTGTIERKLTLDYIINTFSSVKVNKQKPVIRAILRMSVYQLIFMDSIPDSAAINEAVKLAKKKKFNGLTGFVNGVLRKISREKDSIKLPSGNSVKDLSVRYSMPEWLCEHFINECGVDAAIKVLENSLVERPVIIRTNLSKITPDELKDRLEDEGVKVDLVDIISDGPSDCFENGYTGDHLGNGHVGDAEVEGKTNHISPSFAISDFDGLRSLDSFEEGLFCVQDLSSQMLLMQAGTGDMAAGMETDTCGNGGADSTASAGVEKTDENLDINLDISDRLKSASLILDVCAAPGGKTCQAADLVKFYGNGNCKIISRDLTDTKVDKIDENVERCDFDNVETEVHDALELDEGLVGKADIVIADLPCSGLGVIGRKADIKYRVTKDELSELANLQKEILKVVSLYVKEGGMLIFSTCTTDRLENEDNVSFIEDELGFKLLSEPLKILNDSPEHDGFFISRFTKLV